MAPHLSARAESELRKLCTLSLNGNMLRPSASWLQVGANRINLPSGGRPSRRRIFAFPLPSVTRQSVRAYPVTTTDRKSVVKGRRVSVRVDMGGRRFNKKRKKK